MNETQLRILELSKTVDISQLGIRELARQLGVHPQTAKYHKQRLAQQGLLRAGKGLFTASAIAHDALGSADLITLPFLGAANCGPASLIAGATPEGTITLSSRLLRSHTYDSLFAIQADGHSMDKASVFGKPIQDGDYIVVDSAAQPHKGDYVVAVVSGMANIKRYYPEYDADHQLQRIALISESSHSYTPIFIHPEDAQAGLIAGVVLQVVDKPHLT